jgi:DNA-binding MarR family transcriptional regulator
MKRDELIDNLERAVFRLYRGMRRQPALKDMSPQDPVLLKQIAANPGVGVASLADLERLRTPTITSHINRLEKAGMVKRIADPADGRRSGLHITAKGRKAIERATEARHAFIGERLLQMTRDEIAVLQAASIPLLKLGEEPGPEAEVRRP